MSLINRAIGPDIFYKDLMNHHAWKDFHKGLMEVNSGGGMKFKDYVYDKNTWEYNSKIPKKRRREIDERNGFILGREFDKVLGVIRELIDSIQNLDYKHHFKLEKGYVTDLGIQKHLHDFLRNQSWKVNEKSINSLSVEDRNQFYYNKVSDIFRCLKRIKGNAAPFQLPLEDKEMTLEFLDELKRPPREPDWSSYGRY